MYIVQCTWPLVPVRWWQVQDLSHSENGLIWVTLEPGGTLGGAKPNIWVLLLIQCCTLHIQSEVNLLHNLSIFTYMRKLMYAGKRAQHLKSRLSIRSGIAVANTATF